MRRLMPVVFLGLLVALGAPAASSASPIDFDGATVSADYHFPVLGTVLYPAGIAVVGPAVEFPDVGGFGVGISPAVDFSNTNVRVTYPSGFNLAPGSSFDGWVFRVLGGAPAIAGVSLAGTNIAGLTAAACRSTRRAFV